MQVSCFGIDWSEVRKRPSTQAIVDEMLLHDDIDVFATYLPDELWPSDSYMQHFEAAEELETLGANLNSDLADHLTNVQHIVTTGTALDELGVCNLTEGCNFISIAPERVQALERHFSAFRQSGAFEALSQNTRAWLDQWAAALEYCAARELGLIGHAG